MSIWTREFWKTYWFALHRVRTDRRARSLAFRATFFMLWLFGYLAFLCFIARRAMHEMGVWAVAFYAFIFGTGTTAAILKRRANEKLEDGYPNYSLTGQSRTRPVAQSDAPPEVRAYLEERAVIIASLLARGADEICRAQNELAATAATRQIQNSLLRERNLWDKLERQERDLAAVADGYWTAEEQNLVTTWCEQLRVLRWVLRIDRNLQPLAQFPKLDFSLSKELLLAEEPPGAAELVKPWDVRVERDVAAEYTARLVAELKARGLLPDDVDIGEWADEFRAKSIGPSTDYLAGSQTIGELDDNNVRLLAAFAAAREQYCTYLAQLLNAELPFPFA